MKRKYVTKKNLEVVYENVDKAYEYLERALEDLVLMGLSETVETDYKSINGLVDRIDISKLSCLKNLIELKIEEVELNKCIKEEETLDETLLRLHNSYIQYSKDLVKANQDCFVGVGNGPEMVVYDDLKELLYYKGVKFESDINLMHIYIENEYILSIHMTDFNGFYKRIIQERQSGENSSTLEFVKAYFYFIKGDFDLLKSNMNIENIKSLIKYMEIKLDTLGVAYRNLVLNVK